MWGEIDSIFLAVLGNRQVNSGRVCRQTKHKQVQNSKKITQTTMYKFSIKIHAALHYITLHYKYSLADLQFTER